MDLVLNLCLEHLRRLTVECARAKCRSWRQLDQLLAVSNRCQNHRCAQRRTRLVTDQLNQLSQRRAKHRSAQIRFVGNPLIVEAENVEHVGPHFQQHDSQIIAFARSPLRTAAETTECREASQGDIPAARPIAEEAPTAPPE